MSAPTPPVHSDVPSQHASEIEEAHIRNGGVGNGCDLGHSVSLPPPNTFSEYKRSRLLSQGVSGIRRYMTVGSMGESGRRGFNPWQFLKINFRSASKASSLCNLLWPVVPAALAVRCLFSPTLHIVLAC
jgi:hypothetical protein